MTSRRFHTPLLLAATFLLGCPPSSPDLPAALVAADRSGHWLDRPFPAEELVREDGTVDWTILPEAPTPLGTTIVQGWAAQASQASLGHSHQPAVFFRFESEPAIEAGDVGIRGPGGEEVPVDWFWLAEAAGDPFLTDNLLVLMPQHTSPLASGARYVAWVSGRVAEPAPGWAPPEGAPDDVAVATAFTVQPSLGQLRSLHSATGAFLADQPGLLQPSIWRRVVSLEYAQGVTSSGEPSTVATVTFEDGTTEQTFLAPVEGGPVQTFDLAEAWPHEVYEGRIQTVAFQPEEERPWGSPGVGLVGDFDRIGEGWIDFEGEELASPGRAEDMRIVVQIPRSTGPHPVVTWDHGTGGHAYNAVARTNAEDRSSEVAAALESAVVVSRDQPLYGQRYPLIDEGFGSSIGFYNLGNLVAFRDNQRQAAVDHMVLHHFAVDVLPGLVEADSSRVGAFGHSLGSVTAHGGLAAMQGEGAQSAFLSGAGGYLAYYALESGLLGGSNDVVLTLAPLMGLTSEQLAEASTTELLAALIGLPESAWPNMGRHHPLMQLFSTIMDPGDPLMFAADQVVPETILLGLEDLQVPEITTRWLHEVTPDSELIECQPQADYDGHYCLFREDLALDALRTWVAGL